MRIIVTGHLGYIGTVLTPMLLKAGHEVVGMDSDLFRRCTYGDPERIPNVPNIQKDIRDASIDDFYGIDAVIHLAALSNDPLGDLNPALTEQINHQAAYRVAEAAKAAGASLFLFSSTCSNYGASENGCYLKEDAAFNPVTPYGKCKVKAESSIATLADDDFSPVYLRNATAYGDSPRLRFDLVVNNLTAWAVTTGRVHLKSTGQAWRPLVHVEDIARAFVALLETPRGRIHNQAFNVGETDENYQICDVAKIVAQVVPDAEIEIGDGAEADVRNYRVCCDKIREQIPAYVPQRTVKDGVQELLERYRNNGLALSDFEGQVYQRIGHIRSLLNEGIIDDNLRVVSMEESKQA